ncbi:hypothetical protein [Amantichitinum ursilacus]|uniref:Winged helix-turn-helix domain-containing protein n=1 Tax=Amantichitinum ursilacus TaxID=857265 RepID=A0A0N0GRA8_9NEIS|nr:hypothetical protein [Amantichitinum ursilacus]KPC55259.1 hypothetical protein WG78_01335 [Amantichitinum ursilacus]
MSNVVLDIPRPRRALGVMRRMQAGHPLLEAGPLSMMTYLDGYGAEAALWLRFFKHYGWVSPRDWPNGMRAWHLSEKGHEVLQRGEAWWRSLTWFQRLYMWVAG